MAPLPPGLKWEISGSRGDLAQPGGGPYEAQEDAGLEPMLETKDAHEKQPPTEPPSIAFWMRAS